MRPIRKPAFSEWAAYVFSLAVMAICNIIALLFLYHLAITNILMIYLIGILAVVSRTGYGPSVLACVVGVLSFDFFIVPPRLDFTPGHYQYVITLVVVLLFTLSLSRMTARIRAEAQASRRREAQTAALFELSRRLAAEAEKDPDFNGAVALIGDIFECHSVLLVPGPDGSLGPRAGTQGPSPWNDLKKEAAQAAFQKGDMVDLGTPDFPGTGCLFVPLLAPEGPMGVLGLQPRAGTLGPSPDQRHFLQALANLIGAIQQKARLEEENRKNRLKAEAEMVRNALLSSVSHDLRTPLAVITGSASSLLDPGSRLSDASRRELLQDILGESDRLNRFVGNLLEMTRLDSGEMLLKKELQPLEEVLGPALGRLEGKLQGRSLVTDLPPTLPMVPMDGLLMEQVFVNLIENALKYTPAGSPIRIGARVQGDHLELEVSDQGPGLAAGDEEKVFEKFYRGRAGSQKEGVGLGLAICRGVVEAHGGRIGAGNRPEGGARFYFTLPLAERALTLERKR